MLLEKNNSSPSDNAQLLPPNLKAALERIISHQLRSHKHITAMPSAEELELYSRIVPDGAERFMKIVENDQAHRHEMDRRLLTAEIWRGRLPQIFGFVIGLAIVGTTTLCILRGNPWSGAMISTGGMAGMLTAYLTGSKAIARDSRNYKTRPKPVIRHKTTSSN